MVFRFLTMIILMLMTLFNETDLTDNHLDNQFDFAQLQPAHMEIVNDGVMGGVSGSQMDVAETATFSGTLSLDNNGGFASVRMRWPFADEKTKDNSQSLLLKVKGDGLKYQFRLRTHRGFDGAAYVYTFETTAGEQQVVRMNAEDFIPQYRGRQLTDQPPLRWADVVQMGVLVADKQEGPFAIELIALEWQ